MTPDRACICRQGTPREVRVAIYVAGPIRTAQLAGFDAQHSGPGHQPVKRLPPQKGDPK